MGRETTEAISNVLSAYMTGQKEAENKRRWEAEFSLQQEKHQADMQSKMREQQVYEQMQAEKALKDKYTKALMQSGGAAMPPQTAAEIEIYNAYLAGEEAKQRKQFAAEDQARENEKAAYDKTQRKGQEEADAIARKNAAEILRQNKTARTVLDGIPEELRDDYINAAADYKVKQEQRQALDGRVSDLRKQLSDAALNNPTAVQELQKTIGVFEPLLNELISEELHAANKTSQYHQFRDKFHGAGTRADFDSFLDELIAKPTDKGASALSPENSATIEKMRQSNKEKEKAKSPAQLEADIWKGESTGPAVMNLLEEIGRLFPRTTPPMGGPY